MVTRSDAPVEAVPATDALGQEAVIAAALAAPQISEQLAALPEGPPAPPSEPEQLTAAPSADPVPPQMAADLAALPTLPDAAVPAPDLAPAFGVVPSATVEAVVGHITVTALSPDLGGPSFAPLSPLFTTPLGNPLLHGGFGSLASAPLSPLPIHTIPQDHNLIVPPAHADAPLPPVAAPPAPPVPEVHAAPPKPSVHGSPHSALEDGGGADVVMSGGGAFSIVTTNIAGGSTFQGFAINPGPSASIALVAESGGDGSWTFKEGSETLILAPGSHGTIGSGQNAYTIDLGPNGSLSISGLNSSNPAGPPDLHGTITLTSAGHIVATGFLTPTTGLAAGYSVADHNMITPGQTDPHLHT